MVPYCTCTPAAGDGSFFGVTDGFKGKGNGYPGKLWTLCAIYCMNASMLYESALNPQYAGAQADNL